MSTKGGGPQTVVLTQELVCGVGPGLGYLIPNLQPGWSYNSATVIDPVSIMFLAELACSASPLLLVLTGDCVSWRDREL